MRILITGISGFIGGHLEKILSSEYSVFGVIRDEKQDIHLSVPVIADLNDKNYTRNFPKNIDCIVHLAQSPMYRDFPKGVSNMQRVNIDATVQLLEWARKNGVKQFIYTSTANVYTPDSNALHEECPTVPNSFYGATKLAAEHLTRQYQKYFQTDILRLFTVYGPNQRNMLIPNMIERIHSQQEIILSQGAGVYLSPIFVTDVVKVIKKLIESPSNNGSRLVNICGDQIVTLSEIVEILGNLIGQDVVKKKTTEAANYFIGNNSQLRKIIGNYQFFDINSGLEQTIFTET